ncbi:SusC/RagA family TonB-linked outer membrane protein [Chitinophaga horti]|uniref:SusC/RagA family TonB-linked outer membrane protein n=1 Tax=Chitinophaga horti TaxID=2920382 RepID=A0ABY6J2E2_9BACT|nr:SusC/RagA family TonB-linked outer membrane protein [Chitinophaga horti]UYQ93828.1 SusC/RagA family TonB-linked outer membrane protein [Chitinophaga horti]
MKKTIYFHEQASRSLLKRFKTGVFSKSAWLALLLSLCWSFTFAQSRQVTGTVTDAKGEGLFNVNVRVKGTTSGTYTDAQGKFKVSVADNAAVLVFTYLGYEAKEVPVGEASDLKIDLKESLSQLTDVVVVGYGSVQKKNLTNAVTSISSKDFLQGGFNSPLAQIEGKVAGVAVSNTAAADPNNGAQIQVRGVGSIGAGFEPLIVIDGMPGGDLRNIAQQDIESISVLKDASAAAIYGTRGANGVILVQTKKGRAGKVTLTYDGFAEHDAVASKPDILSATEFLAKQRDTDRGARTNWYDELIRKDNFGVNHFLTVSGGSENSIFRLSGNFRNKTGIDIATERREYGYRANFQQRVLDGRLEFSGNLSQRVTKEEYTNYDAFKMAVKLNPTLPIMDPNNPLMYNTLQGFDTYNPVQNLKARENGADHKYSIIDLNIRLNLLKNLNTELKLARQGHERLGREYHTSKSAESVQNNRTGRARLQNETWEDYTLEWLGNYSLRVDKHDITVMGGYTYQEFNTQGFNAENMDFISDAFSYNNIGTGAWNLQSGRLGMGSWKSKEKLAAFLGRVTYNYDDTYFFTGSLRYEANGKFGSDNRWGLFPALSGAWRISNLGALRGNSAINELKLRLSYGVVGRSGFPRYTALARYSAYGKYRDDNGEWIQVYGPGNNYNPVLQWEKAVAYNLGVDFGFFQNRLTGSIDVFERQSKELLDNYDVPVGAYLHDRMFVNVGTASSRGVELTTNYNVVNTSKFNWTTTVTGSYIKSKLKSWSNAQYTGNIRYLQDLPSPGNPGPGYRLEPGIELGSFWGYKYAGVDDQGRIMVWKDGIVGKEKILGSTASSGTDKTYLGHGAPHYELSWGNTFTYGALDLSLYFRGRFDYKIMNLYQMYYGLQAEPGINLLQDAYGRNDHIKSPKLITDYFLENGDFFRLDNLVLGWSPKVPIKYVNSFRIYGAVRNVFTLTKYTGLDPAAVGITGLTPGYGNLDVYPITRTFTFGAQVNF